MLDEKSGIDQVMPIKHWQLPRRQLLQGSLSALGLMLLPDLARAATGELTASLQGTLIERYGDRVINPGRVQVAIPGISENGYSVPLTVTVESPMTSSDHVVDLTVFADKNPLHEVAMFQLGPRAGLARVQTRIRMADSQRILAVAEMNDGTLWSGYDYGIVTLAACVM